MTQNPTVKHKLTIKDLVCISLAMYDQMKLRMVVFSDLFVFSDFFATVERMGLYAYAGVPRLSASICSANREQQ